MGFVVDASMAARWILPDEFDAKALNTLNRVEEGGVFAPALWWFEVRNLLIINERRGRLTEVQTSMALDLLLRLNIEMDNSPDEAVILAFARKHRLTVYDAAYLELAVRRALAIATLDTDLISAAQAEGIPLLS